jgi:hypothetical protein
MSEESPTQDRLVSKLQEQDECQKVDQKQKNGNDVLYVYMNNQKSNVQLYSSTFGLIEAHGHKVKYVSTLKDFYDAEVRAKVVRQ